MRLKGWQVFVFSALGVVGLALGAILLIAVSGLTHSTPTVPGSRDSAKLSPFVSTKS